MNTLGIRLKELRKKHGLTQKSLADILLIDNSSISKYENDKAIPENELLQRIADFFSVSVDYLLGRSDISSPKKSTFDDLELNPKDKKDIEKIFNSTLESLENQEGLMLSGNPINDEDWELLKSAIQNGIEYAKKMNKIKYTPKKYKK
ncbi:MULTISPECIES: helix-turn-helix domain-containing protein [unclassified Clostridium]|uniref:helix-turn-helix domain-containing protein n=1 Tax=Clostridium TaxID=1485 RepID=UPI00321655A3